MAAKIRPISDYELIEFNGHYNVVIKGSRECQGRENADFTCDGCPMQAWMIKHNEHTMHCDVVYKRIIKEQALKVWKTK